MKTTAVDALLASQPDFSNLFNPFVLWTDLGMRAAEAMVESTQDLTDGADRLTRAVAVADSAATDNKLGGIENLQRTYWDFMTHNWLAWASAVGQIMAAGAGVRVAAEPVAAEPKPPRHPAPVKSRRPRRAA